MRKNGGGRDKDGNKRRNGKMREKKREAVMWKKKAQVKTEVEKKEGGRGEGNEQNGGG